MANESDAAAAIAAFKETNGVQVVPFALDISNIRMKSMIAEDGKLKVDVDTDCDNNKACYHWDLTPILKVLENAIGELVCATEIPTASPTTLKPSKAPSVAPTLALSKAPTAAPTSSTTLSPAAPTAVAQRTLDCKTRAFDIALVVDQSGSVGKANDGLQRAAIKTFVQQFKLGTGPFESRAAYTTFSKKLGSKADFTAASATSQAAFGKLVDKWAGNVALAMQGTNTGPALYSTYTAWTKWNVAQMSVRVRFPTKVAIILTDGMPNNVEGCGEAGLIPKNWKATSVRDKELKALECTRNAFVKLRTAAGQVIFVNMGDKSKKASISHTSSVKSLFENKQDFYIEGTYATLGAVFKQISERMCES
jgi:hypothetical protein